MTPVRTVLTLAPLDDRALPAVVFNSPEAAMAFVESARGPIQDLTHRLGEAEPKRQAATIRSVMPAIAESAYAADLNLSAYLVNIQNAINASPGNATLYNEAYKVWDSITLARLEVPYANTLSVLYGGTVFTPGGSSDSDPILRTAIPDLNAAGWSTTASGLRIRDRIVGTGTAVSSGATVTVEYIGWLKTPANRFGEKFDASADHGGTSQFSLNQVIQGWQEGVPGMKPGGIRQLDIPANLAYGAAGQGNIPANADLVFEIKMISSP